MDKKMCDHLLDYYNGILTDAEKKAFEQHMNECKACQAEWAEWQELTADLPYLSEEAEPPLGMKERVLANVFAEEPPVEKVVEDIYRPLKKRSSWLPGALAAGLLLSLGTNAYLFEENNRNEKSAEERLSKVLMSVQLASEQSKSAGTASMIQENGSMKMVVQTSNMSEVKGEEAYQVWLIEGDKKYRAGTFIPDEKGNGAVAFAVKYPGDHEWDAVAITHEPAPDSKQPKGKIVLASNL